MDGYHEIFRSADILLPEFYREEEFAAYPVIACDQHTGELDFWRETERLTKGKASTLDMILPEIYLGEAEARIPRIHAAMRQYEDTILREHRNTVVFVERTQADGRIRRGVVCALDLEYYDYRQGSTPAVRATEGTVLSRIPARVAVRRGADLELPHVMLLLNDPECTVIEPEFSNRPMRIVYDTDLMQGGGHIRGMVPDGRGADFFLHRLNALASGGGGQFTVAVGDGNHSLAAARAWYEELKETIGSESAAVHPARYALVELVNLYSPALDFEPIHRLICGADLDALLAAARHRCDGIGGPVHLFSAISSGRSAELPIPLSSALPLASLTAFLDDFSAHNSAVTVDYIHGEDTLARLSVCNAVGILCPRMEKETLFPAVAADGALPRKTFSMGNACDKRYYLEARKITY